MQYQLNINHIDFKYQRQDLSIDHFIAKETFTLKISNWLIYFFCMNVSYTANKETLYGLV